MSTHSGRALNQYPRAAGTERLGYGSHPGRILDLVYNPNGAKLLPPQADLEADYKREMLAHFGIVFNRLYAITNMPIAPLPPT